MSYLDKIQQQTRWDNIHEDGDEYRLLCSDPQCSLSCANLKSGKLSVTSIHGTERHSYEFTKKDMLFSVMKFLDSLSDSDLQTVVNVYNKSSDSDFILSLKKI